MSNVIQLDNAFFGDLPVKTVLEAALEVDLQRVMVIGVDKDGDLYLATSSPEKPLLLWDLEQVKRDIMEFDE